MGVKVWWEVVGWGFITLREIDVLIMRREVRLRIWCFIERGLGRYWASRPQVFYLDAVDELRVTHGEQETAWGDDPVVNATP